MGVFFAREASRLGEATTLGAGALFAFLTGVTMALSVTACRERLRTRSPVVNMLAAPLTITAAIAVCCGLIGLPVLPRAAAFAAYLTLPAVLVCAGCAGAPGLGRVLAAAVILWLPIEFDLLPQLRLPPPNGLRAAPFAALGTRNTAGANARIDVRVRGGSQVVETLRRPRTSATARASSPRICIRRPSRFALDPAN